MQLSAVRTFSDTDEYFAEIRNLQFEGLAQRRGPLRVEATLIDR